MDKLKVLDNLFTCTPNSHINIVFTQKTDLNTSIVNEELEYKDNYWTKKHRTQDGWWYITYQDIMDQTGLTKKQVIRAVKHLSDLGLIQTSAPVQKDGIKIKWYKYNFVTKDDFMRSPYDGSVSRNYASDNFIIYNKQLSQKIGPASTLIIRDMVTSYIETAKRENLVDGEWFEAKQVSLSKKCGVTEKTMCEYIKTMIEQELIETRQAGWPKQTYVKINFDKLVTLFGFDTFQEAADFLEYKAEEKIKNKMTQAESLTIKLLDEVKKISGQDWDMTHKKAADIEDRLAEGFTEKQLMSIIPFTYEHYKDGEHFDLFNWSNLVGQQSKANYWFQSMKNKSEDEKELLKAEKVTATICAKMAEHSQGEIQWSVDKKKVEQIRRVLKWPENFTEDELVYFALNRYDFNKKHGYKMKAFSTLFSKNEKEHIKTARDAKQYDEAQERLKNRNTKESKSQNPEERSGIHLSVENDLRGKIDQDSITGVQGKDYF